MRNERASLWPKTILTALLAVTWVSCQSSPSDGAQAESPAAEESPAAAPSSAERQIARGLSFALPTAWESQPPSSNMRLAQASVPGPGGAGELTMFHFGVGGGGGVEANLARWTGQMKDADPPQPEYQTLAAGELQITWIEVGGTLKASNMGTFPQTDQPNYRLFGAVVEGPGGPWFLRVTGPSETLEEQRSAWLGMLEGLSLE